MTQSSFQGVGPLPPTLPVIPGFAKRARQALSDPARRKLEAIETHAEVTHAQLRLVTDRVRATEEARGRCQRRLAELHEMHPGSRPGAWVPDRSAGPTARRWQPMADDNPDDLEREVAHLASDLVRLVAERDAASTRWSAASRVAEACRAHLGVPKA